MQSNQRPSVARALELALRDVLPERDLSVRVPSEPVTHDVPVPARYFEPGDYAGESDWWAKQLAHPA
jgi:hypothetical protein